MHPYLHILFLASLAIAAPLQARAAPVAELPLTGNDVGSVYRIAAAMQDRLRCSPVEPGATPAPENIAAATEYGSLASMYAFAAAHYPLDMKGDRVSQINNLVDDAALAYTRAYECNPGLASTFYLDRAIGLLHARVEELGPADERAEPLSVRIAQLRTMLPTPPPCPVCPACPAAPACPLPPSGYRGLYSGRVALSVGLGGGQTALREPQDKILDHLTLRITLGPRFVLGPRKRHILGVGLQYALHAALRIDNVEPAHPSAIHQAGPYFEYGFAPHPQLSLHAHAAVHIGAGLIWLGKFLDAEPYSIHSFNLGGGAALCTLRTALCARGHAHRSITREAAFILGYDVTLNLDFFRLADLALDRKASRAAAPTSH